MGGRLFTDKLVCGRLKVLGVWSLDSATPSPSAYPAHASGSPPTQVARRKDTWIEDVLGIPTLVKLMKPVTKRGGMTIVVPRL
ncbi:MAG: hypothetical protein WCK51_00795 [Armatimonadota bacterium]